MRISTKGQVTIPIGIRTQLGLLPNTEVTFTVKGNIINIQKTLNTISRGQKIIKHLSSRGTINMSTDEIMKLTRNDSR